ncbi:ABC transporter ATP-binding protein [Paracraurococcus lichenis]|uniref:ABC transporter ATP-binding protein n=1 Tax=Paracraurococcus lichenis TaxID=3064888 RepID=A0ABT9EBI8_9PROT|nr:ABC transporter ATP-binding protein [Paracraurococcus sp. LOR1-02]MDO9713582.1 ABC transporter ATP-binding protein [Paracraurococcus sp. LOR1-02]
MFICRGLLAWFPVRRESPLFVIIRSYIWAVPIVGILGFVASGLEGLGISLLIPLLSLLLTDPASVSVLPIPSFLTQISLFFAAKPGLPAVATIIFLMVLVKAIVQAINGIFVAWVDSSAGHEIRCRLAHRLLVVGYPFFLAEDPARLIGVISTEAWKASEAVRVFFSMITAIGATIVFSVLLCIVSWKLFLLTMAGVVLIRALQSRFILHAKTLSERATTANHDLGDRMRLIGFDISRALRVFGQEHREQQRFERGSGEVRKALMSVERLAVLMDALVEVLHAALFIGILLSAYLTGVSVPVLIAFLTLLYRMQPYVRSLSQARLQLAASQTSIQEVEWLLDPTGKPMPPSGEICHEGITQGITFKKVGFTYAHRPEAGSVLSEVSFTIRPNAATALIGRSGSGKSTIVNMLCQLLQPTSGSIEVDGIDLSRIDPVSWRRQIGLAGQDVELIDGTVAENIAYGFPDATMVKIRQAAQLSDAESFISRLPSGYETEIGDRGLGLSGGQRQRIGIARALVRRPSLLILDEATNSIDALSENAILALLRQPKWPMAIVVVSHNLDTLRNCEYGVVLAEGRVVEVGPPAELRSVHHFVAGIAGSAGVG